MGVKAAGLEFYAGPPALGGPDDLDAVIRSFIEEAVESLLIAVQEIDSEVIARAVLAAKVRKVRVKIIWGGSTAHGMANGRAVVRGVGSSAIPASRLPGPLIPAGAWELRPTDRW
ncbi:hypothetical protein [Micromonospora sp. L32]|uniref:hypothetical protein n=1 Tax=Micromonospora sp. L32 TaxID=3452214 RepID=UPI003F8CDFF8